MPARSRSAPVALLVQPNEDERDMYGVCLIRAGFRLLTAHSPPEGFALAVNEQPDVVIVDVRLRAGPDALTFTTTLRLDARTNQMRIIVLTGDAFAPTAPKRSPPAVTSS